MWVSLETGFRCFLLLSRGSYPQHTLVAPMRVLHLASRHISTTLLRHFATETAPLAVGPFDIFDAINFQDSLLFIP